MHWRAVVQAQKHIEDAGLWQSGKVPRSAFPLSRNPARAYRVGNKRWRSVKFTAGALHFRLLILLNAPFEQYAAMLGAIASGEMKVLAVLEHHGTHGSWHCHHTDEDIAKIPAGIKRGSWMKKDEPPPPPPPFTRTGFGIDEGAAYKLAVDFFRLDNIAQAHPTLDLQP